MKTPLFLVLEALDGVGKTTLGRDLAERLGGVAMDTPGSELRACTGVVLAALGPHQAARCLFYSASVLAGGQRARDFADRGTSAIMDRYWLSTISYARARGVRLDLSAIERLVPPPDVTVLLMLDEEERQRRLRARGCTEADRATLAPGFRARVLHEMTSPERAAPLRPIVVVDLTGAGRVESVDRVLAALVDCAPPRSRGQRVEPET